MAGQPTGTVTLLFSDIEGSTVLLRRLGPERYSEALDLHRRLLREAFERNGGYEVDCEGDAFFVAFARAADAVAAASQSQQALVKAEWPDGLPVRVRMGLHTGEPLALPPRYVGLDVHKAARIMAAGHGGQVLASAATQRLVAAEAPLASLGEHRLKDLLQPEPLYQLMIDGLPSEFPALKTLEHRPTNLPVQSDPLIGREREIAELSALLRDAALRLVTLTGPGGTGKTRLAQQAAAELLDEFADGVFFVSLAPIRDAALVIPAVAQALALREVRGEELADTLTAFLEEKHLLLILDNFEQVIGAASAAGELLDRCRGVKLIVTSRERLRVRGERVYPVLPLPLADPAADLDALVVNDAVALFANRADAVAGRFTLDETTATMVAEICARLDGLPLAIELAAARVAALSPPALLARLDKRLPLLTRGRRDVGERQQTLRATIDWSYQLLSEPERRVFERLSVFIDGCRLDAAEAVCADDELGGEGLLDTLASLVDKSLLRVRVDADDEPRYWMLEVIREFALSAAPDVRALEARHARWFAERVTSPRGDANDLSEAELDTLDSDWPNIGRAMAWWLDADDPGPTVAMIESLEQFWFMRGHLREAHELIRRALAEQDRLEPYERATLLRVAGTVAEVRGHVEDAILSKEAALAAYRGLGDHRAIALVALDLVHLAAEHRAIEDERAATLIGEALEFFERKGSPREFAKALYAAAHLAYQRQQLAEAQQLLQRKLDIEREHDLPSAYVTLGALGDVLRAQGDIRMAATYAREELPLAAEIRDEFRLGQAIESLARLATVADEVTDAARLFGIAAAWRERNGAVVYDQREHEDALAHVEEHLASFDREFAAGRALPPDAAIAFAHTVIDRLLAAE